MKTMKVSLAIAAAIMVTFGMGASAMAFHDGGVAHCDGCHTMHNSVDGDPVVAGTVANLLNAPDAGTVCLNCHAGEGSYHILSTTGDAENWTPGGDFAWLGKTWNWTAHGEPASSEGRNHGHNVIAEDFASAGMVADPIKTEAPGGSYPASALTCISCHDPHGKKAVRNGPITGSGSYGAIADPGTDVGNFRLLGDSGYSPTGMGSDSFGAVPTAVTFSPFGPGGNAESDGRHTDYGSGMSEWCATCHKTFLSASNTMKHKAGNSEQLGGLADNYNFYKATGEVNAGGQATSYLALVSFERGAGAALASNTTIGPDSTANVSCLSCHRAHATAFKNIGKWDFTTEFLVDSHPNGNGPPVDPDTDPPEPDGSTPADKLNSYYGRVIETDFNPYQRSLCNKCHLKD
jgi:hypothetical protein